MVDRRLFHDARAGERLVAPRAAVGRRPSPFEHRRARPGRPRAAAARGRHRLIGHHSPRRPEPIRHPGRHELDRLSQRNAYASSDVASNSPFAAIEASSSSGRRGPAPPACAPAPCTGAGEPLVHARGPSRSNCSAPPPPRARRAAARGARSVGDPIAGSNGVRPEPAVEHPYRREMTGRGRDHRSGRPELAGEQRRVQRACTAEHHEREVAGVVAATQRDEPERVRHLATTKRRTPRSPPSRRSRASAPRRRSAPAAASTSSFIAPPRKYDGSSRPATRFASVSVGSSAASSVAGRAGFGARAAGSDVQATGAVGPGDRAAARADLDDLDDRDLQSGSRQHSGRPLDVIQGLDLRASVADRRGLRRRPTDVEGQYVTYAEPPAELRGRFDSGDGAGLQQRDRARRGAIERCHAAGRSHHQQRRVNARLIERVT